MGPVPLVCAAVILSATRAPQAIAQSPLRFTLPVGPYSAGFRTVDQFDYSRSLGESYADDGKQFVITNCAGEQSQAVAVLNWKRELREKLATRK